MFLVNSLTKRFVSQRLFNLSDKQISFAKNFLPRKLSSQPRIIQRPPNLRNIAKKKKKEISGWGWFLTLIPISTFCLGTWQIKRKKWKEELIETYRLRTSLPVVSLPEEESEVQNLEYRKVLVRGHFDHAGEVYLGPRSLLLDGKLKSAHQGHLMTREPSNAPGYLVVTPFILSDSGERILVNRGWVPVKYKTSRTRKEGQISGEVELIGIVRLTEPPRKWVPLNKLDVRIWFSRNVESIAEYCGTRPVFIDATVESTVDGGPIAGQTRSNFKNDHLTYIITWYGISVGTSYLWFKKFLR